MKHTLENRPKNAKVANLATYRARLFEAEKRAYSDSTAADERATLVRHEARAQMDALPSPAIAYASVLLSQDGTITVSASGIEPEFAPAIDAALDRLRRQIQEHGTRRMTAQKGRRGSAQLATILSIAFMAATYVNGIAWLDAAMSLAAQLTMGYVLAQHRRNRRPVSTGLYRREAQTRRRFKRPK